MSCHQEELGISPKTIEKYDEHIKIKLGYADAEAQHRGGDVSDICAANAAVA
jgi:hypothetical protein